METASRRFAAVSLDDSQLSQLDAGLSQLDYSEPLRGAFIGERVVGTLGFTNLALALAGIDAATPSRLPKTSPPI